MKKQIFAVLILLAIISGLVSGCAREEPESTEPIITWDNTPQPTYGQMEYEKLSVLPWYSGRTETSTFHKMVETEQGYYDYNLSTGNTVLVSEPYRENSFARILAPNCIIETNMMYPGVYAQPPQGDSWIAVFDGESWREVQLPPEMATISDEHILFVEGMTSDSILIRICPKRDTMQYNLYRIPIGDEQLRLEYCCKIDFPEQQ